MESRRMSQHLMKFSWILRQYNQTRLSEPGAGRGESLLKEPEEKPLIEQICVRGIRSLGEIRGWEQASRKTGA